MHHGGEPNELPGYDGQPAPGQDPDGEWPPRPRTGPLSRMPSPQSALPALALFLVFGLTSVWTGWGIATDALTASGAAVFGRGEAWRVFTAMAVHGSAAHLASNALLFLVFGWMLRDYFGLAAFPLLSMIAGAGANLATVAAYDPKTGLIGASGMACAMVGLWIAFYLRYDSAHTVPARLLRAAGFSLALLFPSVYDPQTSYLAHAAGFALGLALGFAAGPFMKPLPGKPSAGG